MRGANTEAAVMDSKADTVFLEKAFAYLTARAGRIGAERTLEDLTRPGAERPATCRGTAIEETKARLFDAAAAEKASREEMDNFAALHRKDRKNRLGFDAVADRHGLDENERLILLACAAPAIGRRFAESALSGLASGYFGGTLDVENAIELLDPQSLSERLAARRHFHPESPLIKGGLVLIQFRAPYRIPTDLLDATLHISNKALCELTGAAFLNDERWGGK